MRCGIIAGGNWVIDHVKVIDAWPPQDALATVLSQTWGNGGGPYNVLMDLARLGAPFPLEGIGLLGNDATAELICADCAAHQIGTRQLQVTSAAPSSYTDVMTVAGTGRRTFFHQRGANALLSPEHFDFSLTQARHFHLAYLLLLDRLDEPGTDGRPRAAGVLARARAAGLRTSLDCVSDSGERFQSVVAPVLEEVDVLFANDFEAEKLSGFSLGRGDGLEPRAVIAAAQSLLQRGVREWCIVHFPEGACACGAAGEICWQPSVNLPAAKIAGTVGAGDAFAAGVLYGLHEAWPMARALELGVCAAAASLRQPTASAGVEAVAHCLELGALHGFRLRPAGV
jgi:sugar/nucleoside kinase (ribokinase family)